MAQGDGPRRLVAALWPSLGACALAALWIDFGTIHRRQQGDSLLNILISLYHWTPYMWEQDRFGMLIPLLAWPIKHPLWNLLFQEFLSIFSGLAAFYLLARHLLRNDLYPLAATIGAAGFIALASPYYRFEYLIDTYIAPSLALGLAGLILLEPRNGATPGIWRCVVAAVLLTLAHWVNFGTAVFLGPLIIARALFCDVSRAKPSEQSPVVDHPGAPSPLFSDQLKAFAARLWTWELTRDFVLVGASYELGRWFMSLSHFHHTNFDVLPISRWPATGARVLLRTWNDLAPQYWPIFLGIQVGLIALSLCFPSLRRGSWGAWRAAFALSSAALVSMALTATRFWVVLNNYVSRYYVPPALFFQCAFSILIATIFLGRLDTSRLRRLSALAAPALLVASAAAYGMPSLARVRADLDDTLGARTLDVVAGRCNLVAGDYWDVWPTVFHANLVHYEQHDGQVVWGVTFRGSPAQPLWQSIPRESIRAAIPKGDGTGEHWLGTYGFPKLVEVEQRPTIRIVRPQSRPPLPADLRPDHS
jgi:hypothetical protein